MWPTTRTVEIVGWSQADGDALIGELLTHMTRPEFIYRHRWRVGDVVMWDNCSAFARRDKAGVLLPTAI